MMQGTIINNSNIVQLLQTRQSQRSNRRRMIRLLYWTIAGSIIPNTFSWIFSTPLLASKICFASHRQVKLRNNCQQQFQLQQLRRQQQQQESMILASLILQETNTDSDDKLWKNISQINSITVTNYVSNGSPTSLKTIEATMETRTNPIVSCSSSLLAMPVTTQQHKLNITVLIIDHYDSFTYNLVDYIKQICVNEPIVVDADTYQTWNDLSLSLHKMHNRIVSIDAIILSPGPGNPSSNTNGKINDDDMSSNCDIFQLARDTIRHNPTTPILGVCLGHQIMGDYYGATVTVAPQPIHGQIDTVTRTTQNDDDDDDDPLYQLIPTEFNATRYHSLQVILPDNQQSQTGNESKQHKNNDYSSYSNVLIPTSIAQSDNVIMSMKHCIYPHWGVQYHPESIGSVPYGMTMIRNFLQFATNKSRKTSADGKVNVEEKLVVDRNDVNGTEVSLPAMTDMAQDDPSSGTISDNKDNLEPFSPFNVYIHKVSSKLPSEASSSSFTAARPIDIINKLFDENSKYVIWLDGEMNQNVTLSSSSAQSAPWDSSSSSQPSSRIHSSPISIIGGQFSNLDSSYCLQRVEYWGKEKPAAQQGVFLFNESLDPKKSEHAATTTTTKTKCKSDDDILSYLNKQHRYPSTSYTMVDFTSSNNNDTMSLLNVSEICSNGDKASQVPFDYRGGHLGYLGYEVWHDTLRNLKQRDAAQQSTKTGINQRQRNLTTAEENVPTAAFLWAERSLVYVHETKCWYVIGVHTQSSTSDDDVNRVTNMLKWMETTAAIIESSNCVSTTRTGKINVHHKATSDKMHVSDYKQSFALPDKIAFIPSRSKSTYNHNFDACKEYIRQGESYELCLTNHLETKGKMLTSTSVDDIVDDGVNGIRNIRNYGSESSPYQLYEILRRRNPSPFSAFIDWNSRGHQRSPYRRSNYGNIESLFPDASMAICCSSPERFVSVKKSHKDNVSFVVEAKPIKGTCRRVIPTDMLQLSPEELIEDKKRASELHLSTKNRAENMMIVDLLRNDMSRVCDTGSIHVPTLFGIESFATVHQLVSTIRGTISPQVVSQSSPSSLILPSSSAVNVLQALFPGGSMTGAPKIRTMELLDHLEEGASRGPYSGCLGYISVNGCMDMNIIIRTAILTSNSDDDATTEIISHADSDDKISKPTSREWNIRIGAGGAITALSESDDEYDEMLLKAQAVTAAVEEWAVHSAPKFMNDDTPSRVEITHNQHVTLTSNLNYTLIGT